MAWMAAHWIGLGGMEARDGVDGGALDWIGREGGTGFVAERKTVGPGGTGRSAGAGGHTAERKKVGMSFCLPFIFLGVETSYHLVGSIESAALPAPRRTGSTSTAGTNPPKRAARRAAGTIPSPPLHREHVPPIDCDDLLAEVLLRLPLHPLSFLRASLVCRRWSRLLRDPAFLRRVRAFHRTPPVLGLYRIVPPGFFAVVPIGEAPDRVPPAGFALRDSEDWVLLGCHHGRVLLRGRPGWTQLLVWDPVTGHRRCVRLGQFGSQVTACNATVLGDRGGLARREGSFRVAFVFTGGGRASACLYSSEAGAWGRLITAEAQCHDVCTMSVKLVGGVLYWLLKEDGILEFHLAEERLTVAEPLPAAESLHHRSIQLMEAEDGMLGFAGLTEYSLQLWAREAEVDGSVKWVRRQMIGLQGFALRPGTNRLFMPILVDVDEGSNFAFLWTTHGIFMVSLDTAQFKKVSDARSLEDVSPYSSFYVAGGVGGEGEGDWKQCN